MSSASGASDTAIDIGRLTLGLRLRGEPERLDPVAKRLEGVVRGRLVHALGRAPLAAPRAGTGDAEQELIFIERLAVHCSANTAWDDDALAAHVARRLALALEARLADPDVLRFHDRAEYVAATALAICQGRLAQCWWFGEFDGLQALPASTALRTLVINEGRHGTAALARLAGTSQAQVIGTLGEGDASRLLAWISAFDAPAAPPFIPLWRGALQLQGGSAAPARWLGALVEAERAAPASMGGASLHVLRSMVALLRGAAEGELHLPDVADRATFEAMLKSQDEHLAWLHDLSDPEFGTVVEKLREIAPASDAPATRVRLATPHGGFFLLLARVCKLGWLARFDETVAQRRPDWPDTRRHAICRAIACRIAAVALDAPPHCPPLADAAVNAACDLDDCELEAHEDLAVAALRAALRDAGAARALRQPPAHGSRRGRRWRRLLAEAASVVAADLARALPGLAGSTPAFLRAQALSLPAVVEAAATPGNGDVTPTLVRLGRAPVDVLLVLSGVKRQRVLLPGVPPIQLQEDCGA
jgi:hypothetical protein